VKKNYFAVLLLLVSFLALIITNTLLFFANNNLAVRTSKNAWRRRGSYDGAHPEAEGDTTALLSLLVSPLSLLLHAVVVLPPVVLRALLSSSSRFLVVESADDARGSEGEAAQRL